MFLRPRPSKSRGGHHVGIGVLRVSVFSDIINMIGLWPDDQILSGTQFASRPLCLFECDTAEEVANGLETRHQGTIFRGSMRCRHSGTAPLHGEPVMQKFYFWGNVLIVAQTRQEVEYQRQHSHVLYYVIWTRRPSS